MNTEKKTCAFKFSSEFKKRPGTTDRGKDYEHFYITNLILKLISEEEVENFSLSSNDETFGSFDDVVVEIKKRGKEEIEVYAFQLKHCKNKVLRNKDLVVPKGNFSLLKYYDNFRKSAVDTTVKLILFTNCKSTIGRKIQLTYDQEVIDLDILKCGHNTLLTTSKKGVCHGFNSTKHRQFFRNFTLYANELNVEEMKKNARQIFEQTFKSDVSKFNAFVDFITNWSLAEGKKIKLDKQWMIKVISLCILSSSIQPLSFSSTTTLTQTRQLFKDLVEKFQVTLLMSDCYEKIKFLWSDLVNNLDNEREVKILKQKYQAFLDEDTETMIILWILKKCPLVVEESQQVYQVMKVCNEQNFIVLGCSKCQEKISSMFQSLHDIKRHISLYNKLITTFTYTLEGQKEAFLGDLLEFCQDIDKMITTDLIVQMIDGPLLIGKHKEKLPPCHIERRLTKILIDSQYIKNVDSNTMVAIENVQEPNDLTTNGVYTSKEPKIEELILQNPNKNFHFFKYFDDKCLEWISSKQCPENQDCIKDLEQYRLEVGYGDDGFHESEILSNVGNNINIICADPGMGKTTLMKSFKLATPSAIWAVVVQARNHASHFRKNKTDLQKLLKDIYKEYTSDLDQKVFAHLIDRNQVQIIWDGLDEVSEESLEIILDMIRIVSEKGLKQWVTSRIHLRSLLERNLKTFSRDIKQFDEEEQKKYIGSRLRIPAEDSTESFAKIRRNIMAFSNNDILGIPLQIYMLTELLLKNKSKYILEGIFTVLEIYEHFVEEKFNIFYKEKTKLDLGNELTYQMYAEEKEETVNFYKALAFDLYVSSYYGKVFYKMFRQNPSHIRILAKIKNCGDRFGLVTNPKSSNVEFSHNSFGEYFAASYLFEHYASKTRERAFVSNQRYDNIRFFLDLMLSKNSKARKAFVAILYRNIPLLEQCSTKDINEKDIIGRDVLELSCAWMRTNILPKTKLEEKIFTDLTKVSYGETQKINYENIAAKFIQMQNTLSQHNLQLMVLLPFLILFYDKTKDVFRLKCLPIALYCAIKFDSSFIFDNLKHSFTMENVYNFVDKRALLLLALNLKSQNALQVFMLIKSFHLILMSNLKHILYHLGNNYDDIMAFALHFKDAYGRMTIHYACSIMTNIKDLKFLVDNYENVDVQDAHGLTALHYACRNNEGYEIVKFLVDKGAGVNVPNARGKKPLFYACGNNKNRKMVNFLVSRGAHLDAFLHYAYETNGFNIVYFLMDVSYPVSSSYRGVLKSVVVKFFLDQKVPVDTLYTDNRTLLHYASNDDEGYEIVNLLVDYGANVNTCDKNGLTPVHYACKSIFRYVTLKHLVINGASVNNSDHEGRKPIHYACQKFSSLKQPHFILKYQSPDRNYSGNILETEMVQFLIDNGACVNDTSTNGQTPLHYACKKRSENTAALLIAQDARINISDMCGKTPLHYACENILSDGVVRLLISKGAQMNIRDKSGKLPIDYACNNDAKNPIVLGVIMLLIEEGAKELGGLNCKQYALEQNLKYKVLENLNLT